MKTKSMNRRKFLKLSGLAVAAPMIVPSSALGRRGAVAPSDRLVFAAIGTGNRSSRVLLPWFLGFEEVQFVAVCDCWEERRSMGKEIIDRHYGNGDCAQYDQIEDVLARDDLDGVVIATGDRMHAVASIMAARAGKDVYSEKPHALTIEEGRMLAKTAANCGTVYQCGHQRRSVDTYRFQQEVVRKGLIGKVHTAYARTWRNDPAGPAENSPVPEGLDWNTWLGPTPFHPFNRRRLASWIKFYDTGGGSMTDMGVHYIDLAQWALDKDHTGPVKYSVAGYFDPNNVFDTPVTSKMTAEYADGTILILDNDGAFADRTIRFEGDEGWIQVDDHTMKVSAEPASILKRQRAFSRDFDDMGGHVRNLLDCMRTRNRKTVCHPENVQRSSTIAHIGNICARLGCDLEWDPVNERFLHNDEADRMLSRAMRYPWHL